MIQNPNPPVFEHFTLESAVPLAVNSNRKLKNIYVCLLYTSDAADDTP